MTLTELIELRAEYHAAERAILTGQNYSIEGISVSRPDLDTVIKRIAELDKQIRDKKDSGSGRRIGVSTPRWR